MNGRKKMKMSKVKFEIELPKIIEVSDYHDFEEEQYILSKRYGINVKIKEIGFNAPDYVGLVYTGIKPLRKEIDRCCQRDLGMTLKQLEEED
jgi:hypothetical protein